MKTFTINLMLSVLFLSQTLYAQSDSCNSNFTFSVGPEFSVEFINLSTGPGTYWWDFGDGAGTNLTSPTHVYADEGDYTVVLTITTDSCVNSDSMVVALRLADNIFDIPDEFSVYPNPFISMVTIKSNGFEPVELFDIYGGRVKVSITPAGENTYNVFTEAGLPGIYFLKLSNNTQTILYPLIRN